MKILIPTDFSSASKGLIERVLESHHQTSTITEILLLNTFIVNETDPELVIVANDKLKLESRTSLCLLKSQAEEKNKNPHISIETASHLGSLKNVVQQILKKESFNQMAVTKEQANELASIKQFLKEKDCLIVIA